MKINSPNARQRVVRDSYQSDVTNKQTHGGDGMPSLQVRSGNEFLTDLGVPSLLRTSHSDFLFYGSSKIIVCEIVACVCWFLSGTATFPCFRWWGRASSIFALNFRQHLWRGHIFIPEDFGFTAVMLNLPESSFSISTNLRIIEFPRAAL